MGFLSRLFGPEKRSAAVKLSDLYLTEFFGLRSNLGAEGLAVTERCRALISQNTASVPLLVYRQTEDGKVEDQSHPLYRLLNDEASDGVTSFSLRAALARDAATYGNGLAQIVRNYRGEVDELIYWPWTRVSVELLANGRPRYRVTDHMGHSFVLLRDEVAHLRYETRDGIIGISPLDWADASKGLAASQAGLAQEQADRGLVSDIAFETDRTFDTDNVADVAFRRLREQLGQAVRGLRTGGKPLLLEAGLKAKAIATSGREAQFVELYTLSLEDIARAHGVPLSVVGLGRNASYGSLTEESRSLLRDCIGPWAERIERQLAVSLLSREARATYSLEHDLSGLQRGDMQARFTAYNSAVDAGWLLPNEPRTWEGLNRIPGGDAPLRPQQSQTQE